MSSKRTHRTVVKKKGLELSKIIHYKKIKRLHMEVWLIFYKSPSLPFLTVEFFRRSFFSPHRIPQNELFFVPLKKQIYLYY